MKLVRYLIYYAYSNSACRVSRYPIYLYLISLTCFWSLNEEPLESDLDDCLLFDSSMTSSGTISTSKSSSSLSSTITWSESSLFRNKAGWVSLNRSSAQSISWQGLEFVITCENEFTNTLEEDRILVLFVAVRHGKVSVGGQMGPCAMGLRREV